MIPDAGASRLYVATLTRTASWRLGLSVALLLGVTLGEGVGLLLLIPLLSTVGLAVDHGAMGRLGTALSSLFAAVGLRPTLPAVLGLYVLVVSGQALLQRAQRIVNLRLMQELSRHLRTRLYAAITRAHWLYLSRQRSTDFVHLLTSEVDRVGAATGALLALVAQLLIGSVYLSLAFYLAAEMTLVALACGLTLLFLLRRGSRVARSTGEALSVAMADLYTAVDQLQAIKTTKSCSAEERNVARFEGVSDRISRLYVDTVRNVENVAAWYKVGSVVLLSALLFASVEVFALPSAAILLLLYLFARLVPRFSSCQQAYHVFSSDVPAVARVLTTIRRAEAASESARAGNKPLALRFGVQLEGVSFGYRGDQAPPAVARLDLHIPARRTTALVGPSGGGKSTVADLVMGLLVPDAGRVLVDGEPLEAGRVGAWRAAIGYVPQDTLLFHDSVRANLLWARPEATDAQLWDALRLAAADGFVARLPEGLDTGIGDRGVQLSGGERQRLALARALLRQPSLLILDEATSALDSENERRIQQAVQELHGRITILLITHRLSSVQDADVIHVLEDGGLVESGGWDELLTLDGRFAELCRAQKLRSGTGHAESRQSVSGGAEEPLIDSGPLPVANF